MKTAYNVIIDHDYLAEGDETFVTVRTRGEAEKVIRDDQEAFAGDKARWRAFIEEVFVFDDEAFEQESRRVEWFGAEMREMKSRANEQHQQTGESPLERRERVILPPVESGTQTGETT